MTLFAHAILALNKRISVAKNPGKILKAFVKDISKDVDVSIELDTAVYLDQFASNNTGPLNRFRLIKSLKSGLLLTVKR